VNCNVSIGEGTVFYRTQHRKGITKSYFPKSRLFSLQLMFKNSGSKVRRRERSYFTQVQ
jgi:hypothetical protein